MTARMLYCCIMAQRKYAWCSEVRTLAELTGFHALQCLLYSQAKSSCEGPRPIKEDYWLLPVPGILKHFAID